MNQHAFAGLDFGTTNSAIATLDAGGLPQVTPFPSRNGFSTTFPSLLFFERTDEPGDLRVQSYGGPQAIEHYLQAEGEGRLIQSLKAYLSDRNFEQTNVFGRNYSLGDLISKLLGHLRSSAAGSIPQMPARAVVGRPVHFSNTRSDAIDQFAQDRLLAAVQESGFTEIVFEYEPVAAAYSYERTLTSDELILVGDFGGGTSDFSVLHVGTTVRNRGHRRSDLLGTDGVAIAGDAFDRQIVRHLVAPALGLGSEYLSPPDKKLPIPSWPYSSLERWHYLSLMNRPQVIRILERVGQTADRKDAIEAFIDFIRNERGYQLHESVRKTKFELSQGPQASFEFRAGNSLIRETVTRASFEQWIEEELATISACVDRVLQAVDIAPARIDRVFLTGGSSFVPAVRKIFVDRFGAEKIAGGNELTSVAAGLALRAADEWGGGRAG